MYTLLLSGVYSEIVERTQIYLDDDLKRHLRARARTEGRSLAAVVRDAAAEYLARRDEVPDADPLLGLIGIGEGGPPDGAVNHDAYLYGAPREKKK